MEQDSIVADIKERVDIVALISRYVPLKQAGRNFKGLCPFHQEKTPSFNVSREYRSFKCFGCDASGDVFEFLQRIEGLTFVEAAERLAREVGLEFRPSGASVQQAGEREQLAQVNEFAARHFQRRLGESEAARDYLAQRGLSEETIRAFGLGYAPESWDDLLHALSAGQQDLQIAQRAGLLREREGGGYYDYFRHRIMFPIVNVAGRTVGFGGRTLSPDDPAKYMNSPETALFRKGRTLYGLNLANRAIAEAGYSIVVEGYTDVIALRQAGVPNVVATLGTALTPDHARVLARYGEEIVLAYDADSAGMAAVVRNARSFEGLPVEVKVLELPEGMDPDDCVRAYGKEGFLAALDERTTLIEYRLALVFRDAGEDPDARLRTLREAALVLRDIPDRVRRAEFARRIAERWAWSDPDAQSRMQRELLFEGRAAKDATAGPPASSPGARSFVTEALERGRTGEQRGRERRIRDMLGAMLADVGLARRIRRVLGPAGLPRAAQQQLLEGIYCQLDSGVPEIAGEALLEALPDGESRDLALELLMADQEAEVDPEVALAAARRIRQEWEGAGEKALYEACVEPPEGEVIDRVAFEEFEREVLQRIQEGKMTSDDPAYVRYHELRRRFHGRGQLEYWEGS